MDNHQENELLNEEDFLEEVIFLLEESSPVEENAPVKESAPVKGNAPSEGDILTEEDYALLEANRKKRSFWDNWFVIGIKSAILLYAGEILFGLGEGLLVTLLILSGNSLMNTNLEDALYSGNYFASGFLNTANMYFVFIGIWIVVLLWCLIRKRNRPLFRTLTTYTKGNNLKMALIGLLIGGGMNGFCALIAWLHGDFVLEFQQFELVPMLVLMLMVLIQSSAEELVCRVYFYQKLMKSYNNPKVAILVNTLFFAALHLANPGMAVLPFIDIILSGILFSMMIYYMDSFWAACTAHMAWNYTQNILLGLPNSGQLVPYSMFSIAEDSASDSLFYNAAFGIEGSLLAIIVQALAIVAIYLYYRNRKVEPTDIWA